MYCLECVQVGLAVGCRSGSFRIDEAGDFGLRVYNRQTLTWRILPVDVALKGSSVLVTIGKIAENPPYRIENRFGPFPTLFFRTLECSF